MSDSISTAARTARIYYNSKEADDFYFKVWGGENIHVGIYDGPDESIATASWRTVEHMASKLKPIGPNSRVLDIGAGYGGAARYLAGKYACSVVALNISETANDRNRLMNKEQGLDHLVEVVEANFEEIPYPPASFDIVWSQDAMLHSGRRDVVLREVARVLTSSGEFIFTDLMQTDTCPEGVLKPILDRIHLEDMASPGFYRETAQGSGFLGVDYQDLTPHLTAHYASVLRVTEEMETSGSDGFDPEYIARMKTGLRRWVEGGEMGYLAWGVFHCTRG